MLPSKLSTKSPGEEGESCQTYKDTEAILVKLHFIEYFLTLKLGFSYRFAVGVRMWYVKIDHSQQHCIVIYAHSNDTRGWFGAWTSTT